MLFLLTLLLTAAPDAGEPASDAGVTLLPPRPIVKNPLSRKADDARVEKVFASLDARGKAGQLLLAYPQLGKGPVEVGGVVFVGNSLKNVQKAKEKISSLRERAKVQPFFAVDMEGGPSNRLKSVKALKEMPGAKEMAALDDKDVRAWGKKVGLAMHDIGLDLNLAPVLDVAATGHMADNGRSFSGDPEVVAAKAIAYAKGLLEVGVVPIGKHFPGYGDVAGDSDHALVSAPWDKARVQKEIAVFTRAQDVLGGVMLANVAYPAFDEKPAILAPSLISLAHAGEWISVTDDLSIQLLADTIKGTPEDVLKQALLAGNDLLLTTAPPDWDKGLDYLGILTKLYESDPEAKKKIDAACRRILRLKDKMGLLE